jgi:serine/threonine-protein kinase RsbW
MRAAQATAKMKGPEIHNNKIVIPSDQELIAKVDEFVETRLRDRNIDDSIIADIAICATEVVNNGIIHGNKDDRSKTVTLEMVFSDGEVTITVTDQGDFFDANHIASPVDDENLMREVGRGIFIVKNLMDQVDIERANGGGTRVILIKKLK